MKSVISYVQVAGRVGLAEFCEACPESVLILGTFNTVDDSRFLTLDSAGELGDGAILVAPIAKSSANAFSGMITIGRARNNDLQIREATVSKFHAYLQREPDTTELSLVDAASTVGTWVNGEKLEPQVKRLLNSGDQLQFGKVPATIYEPAAFYTLLQQILAGQRPG